MKAVTLYTTPFCGYCMAAKRLLADKGVAFDEIDLFAEPARRGEMIGRARGGRTVPQIFVGERAYRRLQRNLRSSTGPASSTRCSRAAEPMRAALLQLCSGDDPAANLAVTEALLREAAAGGAGLVLTPECTNIVSLDRERQRAVLARGGGGRDAGAARARWRRSSGSGC